MVLITFASPVRLLNCHSLHLPPSCGPRHRDFLRGRAHPARGRGAPGRGEWLCGGFGSGRSGKQSAGLGGRALNSGREGGERTDEAGGQRALCAGLGRMSAVARSDAALICCAAVPNMRSPQNLWCLCRSTSLLWLQVGYDDVGGVRKQMAQVGVLHDWLMGAGWQALELLVSPDRTCRAAAAGRLGPAMCMQSYWLLSMQQLPPLPCVFSSRVVIGSPPTPSCPPSDPGACGAAAAPPAAVQDHRREAAQGHPAVRAARLRQDPHRPVGGDWQGPWTGFWTGSLDGRGA